MKEQFVKIYRLIGSFLLSIVNREFLIFLFFLAVSGTFWLLLALNESYEREFEVPVVLTGVPRDVVITTEMADTVRITVRDKGFSLAAYMYGDGLTPITFQFKNYTSKDNGHAVIPQADLLKQLNTQLYGSTKVISVKPDKLEFYYNHGISRRLPVKLVGTVVPDKKFYLSRTIISPSKVTVYANRNVLDSITSISTLPLHIQNFEDTVVKMVALRPIRGAKMVPPEVKVTLCADILTEESIEVPIEAVNMPEGKVLRTFPSRVKVRFVVGASQYRLIKADHFRVEADYNELVEGQTDKCNIYLRKTPANVRNARLDINQVDYLVEQ